METIGVEFKHADDFSEEDEEVTTYMNPFGRTDLVQEDEEFVDAKVKYSVESYDETLDEKQETDALVALEQGPLRFGEMISSAMLVRTINHFHVKCLGKLRFPCIARDRTRTKYGR